MTARKIMASSRVTDPEGLFVGLTRWTSCPGRWQVSNRIKVFSKRQVEVTKKLSASSDTGRAGQQCRNDQILAGHSRYKINGSRLPELISCNHNCRNARIKNLCFLRLSNHNAVKLWAQPIAIDVFYFDPCLVVEAQSFR